MKPRKFTDAELLQAWYATGCVPDAARRAGCSEPTMYNRLRTLGVVVDDAEARRRHHAETPLRDLLVYVGTKGPMQIPGYDPEAADRKQEIHAENYPIIECLRFEAQGVVDGLLRLHLEIATNQQLTAGEVEKRLARGLVPREKLLRSHRSRPETTKDTKHAK